MFILPNINLQLNLYSTGLVHDDIGWYLVSISWHCLVLGGTGSAKGLYAYMEKVEIWSGVTDASLTHTDNRI